MRLAERSGTPGARPNRGSAREMGERPWHLNETGIEPNSLNNDDAPSPQSGLCPSDTDFCTFIQRNRVHGNINPNVPAFELSGETPVGAGIEISGGIFPSRTRPWTAAVRPAGTRRLERPPCRARVRRRRRAVSSRLRLPAADPRPDAPPQPRPHGKVPWPKGPGGGPPPGPMSGGHSRGATCPTVNAVAAWAAEVLPSPSRSAPGVTSTVAAVASPDT